MREVACMSEASGVPLRKWRCAHYGRGGRAGQRERAGRAGLAKARPEGGDGFGRRAQGHGGMQRGARLDQKRALVRVRGAGADFLLSH